MIRHAAGSLIALVLSLTLISQTADAGERLKLGYGRLVTNDYFGDGQDRWRTGSWTSSRMWGPAWTGEAPTQLGDLIELRIAAEVMAPDNLDTPDIGDRPYAGSLSVGAHTHFKWQGFDTAFGGDLVMVGSGTGLGSFQRGLHKVLGVDLPSNDTLNGQIDGIYPTVVGEIARDVALGQNIQMRPFLEGRAGAETMIRAGVDLVFGSAGQGEMMVRESVTGHRYRVISDEQNKGFSFLLGADIAHVSDSVYLPEERGFTVVEKRDRLRAGMQWQGESASAFYGVTYLGEEFEAQTEGQFVGSIRIKLSF